MPSKLRFRRTFTTPAIASDPYVDDEPPVRISTPSMSAVGTVLRSTTPVGFEGVRREPSTSTSVRGASALPLSPRRSTLACPPFEGLLEVVEMEGTSCGSELSTVSTCTSPESSKVSASTVTTGLVAS